VGEGEGFKSGSGGAGEYGGWRCVWGLYGSGVRYRVVLCRVLLGCMLLVVYWYRYCTGTECVGASSHSVSSRLGAE